MRLRILAVAGLSFLLLTGFGSRSSDRAVPAPPATNPDGTIRTAGMHARFNPAEGVVPFPNNLLFSGSTDGTLNIPVADPDNFGDPQAALNTLSGFSTVAPWATTFSQPIDPASVISGGNVRVFEVETPVPVLVTGVVRELTPGADFVATVAATDPSGRTLAIVPLSPLSENTSYLVVLTESIRDTAGNWSKPDQPYFLAKRSTPLVTATGASAVPLLPDASAQALEPLRQLTQAQLGVAAAVGIAPDSVVLSWLVTTQSVTDVLDAVRATAQPTMIQVAPTGLTTADVLPPGASPGIADLYIGVVELPYYLGIPNEENPVAALTGFWRAPPCAEFAPCEGAGLDPDSTNLTRFNPFPVETGRQIVPVLMSVPNANSGQAKPETGWPVMMFLHGITGSRTNMLPLADTMASQGVAVIAIDQPLHGITDRASPLYVGNTPFGAIANERTFDMDLSGDGEIDASGAHFINLASLLTSRDNLRQAQADLSVLALNIPDIDLTGDGEGDTDPARISFTGMSLGAIAGTAFLAAEPTVNHGVLNVGGGGVAGLLHGSDTFGPVIRAGLEQAGVEPFSADYFQFLSAAQTVIDPADPVNWALFTATDNAVLVQQVAGDAVVPNFVPGFPHSGTEPLIREMELAPISETTMAADGIRGAVRFTEGVHGSLLSPEVLDVTVEMQTQVASFIASGGTLVVVNDASVILVPELGIGDEDNPTDTGEE